MNTTDAMRAAWRHPRKWQHVAVRECGCCGEERPCYLFGVETAGLVRRRRADDVRLCAICLRTALDAIGDVKTLAAKRAKETT